MYSEKEGALPGNDRGAPMNYELDATPIDVKSAMCTTPATKVGITLRLFDNTTERPAVGVVEDHTYIRSPTLRRLEAAT